MQVDGYSSTAYKMLFVFKLDVCRLFTLLSQRAVFQGLSQEALSACILSLLKASECILKNKVRRRERCGLIFQAHLMLQSCGGYQGRVIDGVIGYQRRLTQNWCLER